MMNQKFALLLPLVITTQMMLPLLKIGSNVKKKHALLLLHLNEILVKKKL